MEENTPERTDAPVPDAGTEPVEDNSASANEDTPHDDVAKDDFCSSYIKEHGISPEYARQCGLRSLPDGWNKKKSKHVIGGLLIPDGSVSRLRRRRTHIPAEEEGGHVVKEASDFSKFTGAPGSESAPYFPPARMPAEWMSDTTADLYISEGPVKALCLTESGFPCVGMSGVEAGPHDVAAKRNEGALEPHPRLRSVAWTGRKVYIAYDAFRTRNTSVARGEAKLAYILAKQGALVSLIVLPPDSRGTDIVGCLDDAKDQGPDDFIVRKGVDAFRALVTEAIPADPVERVRACADVDQARLLLDDLTVQAALDVRGSTAVADLAGVFKRKFKSQIGKAEIRSKVGEYNARVSAKAFKQLEKDGGSISANKYETKAGATCLVVETMGGTRYRQIANFTARITHEVAQDDGITASKSFTVECTLAIGMTLPSAEVPAAKWNDRTWVTETWGVRAVVEAGKDSWGHLLAAIQTSSNPVMATVYSHTGWRKVGDRMAYLFPNNSTVGASNIDVRNPDDSGRYGLPTGEATKEEINNAIRRSLALITIGDPNVTVPALASAYTAPLSSILEIDFGVWLAGESGSCKSGLAGIILSHFGKYNYSALPQSWMSTVNAIENFLFKTKDTLAVIDNYIPGDKDGPVKVNRIVQQIGDRGSRGRLNKASETMASRPPRGLMLATGEDVPVGSSDSTIGRLVVVRMKKADGFVKKVVEASHDAEDYGLAMRAYLEWLASDYETHAADVRHHREEMASGWLASAVEGHSVHPRTARSVATLAAGLMTFLHFAREVRAITDEEYEQVKQDAARALVHVAREQASLRENTTPVQKYITTLRALLVQGKVTLADRSLDLDPEKGIGWDGDDEFIYLQPDLAWKALEDFYSQGQRWLFSKVGMHQALIEAGLVHRGEPGKATTKRTVGIGRGQERVLLVRREHLAEAIPVRVPYGLDDEDDVGIRAH